MQKKIYIYIFGHGDLLTSNFQGWQGISSAVKQGIRCPVHKTPWAGIEPTQKQSFALLLTMKISCLSDASSVYQRCENCMAINLGYKVCGPV